MTKQQDNTKRDYSQFSKAKAIKEIEKLTGLEIAKYNKMVFSLEPMLFFENHKQTIEMTITSKTFYVEEYEYGERWPYSIPIKWLEPLSRLIPILFKEGE